MKIYTTSKFLEILTLIFNSPEVVRVILMVQVPDLDGAVRSTGGQDPTTTIQLVQLKLTNNNSYQEVDKFAFLISAMRSLDRTL